MNLKDQFDSASQEVLNLDARPSNDNLLKLYAYYKQGSLGDVTGKRPGMLDIKGRAKFDAWADLKGMDSEEAMQKYVELVDSLK